MNFDLDELKKSILSIQQSGGTNFERGYSAAINQYETLFKDDDYKLNIMCNYRLRHYFATLFYKIITANDT